MLGMNASRARWLCDSLLLLTCAGPMTLTNGAERFVPDGAQV